MPPPALLTIVAGLFVPVRVGPLASPQSCRSRNPSQRWCNSPPPTSKVSDTSLVKLAKHSKVEALELRGTHCTDSTILALNSACPLASLSIPAQTSNKSAAHIAKTFPGSLTDLDLSFSAIDGMQPHKKTSVL